MPNSSSPKLSIAICGGGLGGLSLAVALSSHPDIQVDIFEKAADFVPMAGAGMSVWPRTVGILRKWGIDPRSFQAIVTQSEVKDLAWEIYKSNQPRPGRHFHTWKLPGGLHSFHRAHFLELLSKHLPPSTIHYNAELHHYTQSSDTVTLFFTNGLSRTFDALIACDGLWSPTRTQMYKDLRPRISLDPSPYWTGSVVFRAMIPYAKLQALQPNHRALKAPQMYCGKGLRVLTYPMNMGQFINFVAFFSNPSQEGTSYEDAWAWQTQVTKSFLVDTFANWEPEVRELISLVPDKTGPPGPTRWPIYALRPLPKYVHGHVVLLGDSAHATTPHWGFGACSSIEDANVLAALLSHPSVKRGPTLTTALSVYERLRVAEGKRIIEGSRRTGLIYEFNGPMGDNLSACAEGIQKQTAWIAGTNPEEGVREAVQMLNASLAR